MGTTPLVQGFDPWFTVRFTGFEAAERFAQKSHHGTRAEDVHSARNFLSRSPFLKDHSKSPSRNSPLIVSNPVSFQKK